MRILVLTAFLSIFVLLQAAMAEGSEPPEGGAGGGGANCAGGILIIGNWLYHCDNACVVTVDPATGVTSIEDCCGGGFTITILREYETIGDVCP